MSSMATCTPAPSRLRLSQLYQLHCVMGVHPAAGVGCEAQREWVCLRGREQGQQDEEAASAGGASALDPRGRRHTGGRAHAQHARSRAANRCPAQSPPARSWTLPSQPRAAHVACRGSRRSAVCAGPGPAGGGRGHRAGDERPGPGRRDSRSVPPAARPCTEPVGPQLLLELQSHELKTHELELHRVSC